MNSSYFTADTQQVTGISDHQAQTRWLPWVPTPDLLSQIIWGVGSENLYLNGRQKIVFSTRLRTTALSRSPPSHLCAQTFTWATFKQDHSTHGLSFLSCLFCWFFFLGGGGLVLGFVFWGFIFVFSKTSTLVCYLLEEIALSTANGTWYIRNAFPILHLRSGIQPFPSRDSHIS